MATKIPFSIPVILCLAAGLVSSQAQVTAFTYQGRLNDGQSPANGSYDLKFTIFDSGTNGEPQGPVLTNSATAVTNGLFTVMLDFGNQFPGASRWLEVGVRTNDGGAGNFTSLTPRQLLTAAPYSIMSENVAAGGIAAGVYTNAVIFANANNQFSGNGAGLTNLSGAKITGLGALAFSNTVALPANVVTGLDTTTIFRLTMFTAGYGSGSINDEAYSTNGVEMYVGASPTNLVLACNTPIYQDPGMVTVRDPDHIRYVDNNGNVTYIMAYTTHYGDWVASATPGYGVATSPDDFTWTFLGYVPYPSYAIWSPKHFVDATNGLHVIFLSGSTNFAAQPNAYTIGDVNPTNFLQVSNFRNLQVYDNSSPGGGCIKYINDLYYFFSGNGAESVNTQLISTNWQVINYDTSMQNGSTVVWYKGLWYWLDTYPNCDYITSPDLTNWCSNPIQLIPGSVASGDGSMISLNVPNTAGGLGLTPQNYLVATGQSPLDGSGLTNLNAAQLTGTVPTSVLPGVTANISIGGMTLQIVNGLIMQITKP